MLDPRLGRGAIWVAAIVALAAAVSSGGRLRDYRFETHLERAQRYIEQDQLEVALIELHSALGIRPDDVDVNFRLAELEALRRNGAEARFYYRETNRYDPENVEAAVKFGRLLLADQPARGSDLIEAAAAREPENVWGRIGLSELALVTGDTNWALETALEANRLAPEEPAARWQLIQVRFAQIRELGLRGSIPPKALIDVTRDAIGAYIRVAGNQAALGMLAYARLLSVLDGQQRMAKWWFGQALQTASKSGDDALLQHASETALAYARKHQAYTLWKAAAGHLVRLDSSRFDLWGELADIAEKSEGSRSSIYLRVLTARPEDADASVFAARQIRDELGVDEALAFLRRRVDAGIDPPVLLGVMSDMQLADGRESDWEQTATQIISLYPRHPRASLARAHLLLTRPAPDQSPAEAAGEAASILRTLVEHDESPLAQQLLAASESRLENHARALKTIERAIELAGESLTLNRLHAKILHDSGHWQYALPLLLRIRTETELSPQERVMMARCAYQVGEHEFGRALLVTLLLEEDPPVAAALELAEHEIPAPSLQPKIIRLLDLELERGARDPQVLALATALDLETGERERAIGRMRRQINRELALGAQLREWMQEHKSSGDEEARQRAKTRIGRSTLR